MLRSLLVTKNGRSTICPLLRSKRRRVRPLPSLQSTCSSLWTTSCSSNDHTINNFKSDDNRSHISILNHDIPSRFIYSSQKIVSSCVTPFFIKSTRYQYYCQKNYYRSNNVGGNDDDRRRYLSSAFVSRHNYSLNVTADKIVDYCRDHGASVEGARTTNTHVVLRECPFCSKPTRNEASNLYKLHIQIGGGAYFCHRCGTGGSWFDLKANFGGFKVERGLGRAGGGSGGGGGSSFNNNGNGNGNDNNNGSRGQNKNFNDCNYSNRRGKAPSSCSSNNVNNAGTEPCLPMPPTRLSGLYSSRLLDQNIDCSESSNNDSSNNNDALRYLTEIRGLYPKTLRKYGVGRAAYQFPSDEGGYRSAECVTFPWIMRESDVKMQESLRGATFTVSSEAVADKRRNDDEAIDKNNEKVPSSSSSSSVSLLTSDNKDDNNLDVDIKDDVPIDAFLTRRIKARALERKSWQRLDPPGGGWGLFGLHTVPNDCTELVLTEGEYDAMAVCQATGRSAVSLPNGCRSLPLHVLPLLERFEKIYLWMDNDEPGREGAEKFAKKLGVNRTYIVHCLEAKDANDALLRGDIDMNQALNSATLLPHDRIITFKDLRNDVLQELLEPDLYSGTPIPSLPKFSQIIKGFRRGEMTVLTGPTGSGKTTFLGQVSLDLAEQGENVLWGSFEIKNTRLLHKLMKQFSRDSLPISTDVNAREKFEALADRFETLPLYFMRFHGGSDVDEVLDAMEYAVYVNDVEHIFLDNMQFMITRHSQKSSFDKFEVQDLAIEKFRKFVTEHNVHVTLVVHPRKEDESSKLSISSFFGSAKATQEADTVIIIQNDANRRKYLDVKKNRFDGTLGTSQIHFQSRSGRYVEDEGNAGSVAFNQQKRPPKDIDRHWEHLLSPPTTSRA